MSRRGAGLGQSYEIAGGRSGLKLLLFGTNVLYFQRKLNYIDVDDSVSFHISFEKILIYLKYRYIAQPYCVCVEGNFFHKKLKICVHKYENIQTDKQRNNIKEK